MNVGAVRSYNTHFGNTKPAAENQTEQPRVIPMPGDMPELSQEIKKAINKQKAAGAIGIGTAALALASTFVKSKIVRVIMLAPAAAVAATAGMLMLAAGKKAEKLDFASVLMNGDKDAAAPAEEAAATVEETAKA